MQWNNTSFLALISSRWSYSFLRAAPSLNHWFVLGFSKSYLYELSFATMLVATPCTCYPTFPFGTPIPNHDLILVCSVSIMACNHQPSFWIFNKLHKYDLSLITSIENFPYTHSVLWGTQDGSVINFNLVMVFILFIELTILYSRTQNRFPQLHIGWILLSQPHPRNLIYHVPSWTPRGSTLGWNYASRNGCH